MIATNIAYFNNLKPDLTLRIDVAVVIAAAQDIYEDVNDNDKLGILIY